MHKWKGASGVCVNENNELLMVLQGKPEEVKKWTAPSGGVEEGETYDECCLREFNEETGNKAEIIEKVNVKKGRNENHQIDYEVHYFKVKVIGGTRKLQDPDQLIHAIEWKTKEELAILPLAFKEDQEFLLKMIT
ncbi:NUDIX hydrolase [Pontibacillus salipaludis]|uniref:DNA mismatch repair protein MutT n=1 Tax=Pontibacillus salipaludis TaxID=1697394 RepID=A0ABQ1Q3U2_9BACI|nr:NUDIX hydrolase [Pontibacillus salipaludis]GGD11967.1 DNA mismatch repair protein MutT [Pontibacillus salipaludis]